MVRLRTIPFSEFYLWDVKRFVKSTFSFAHSNVRLKDVLSQAKIEWVDIEDEKKYPILGVRAQGKGVYLNRVALGKELTMRRYQKSKPYHLFYCKVRTVNGQWGIVYPEFENTYGSSNMQYLEINLEKLKPEYLELLLKVKSLTNEWDISAGGADGRHFTLNTLLSLKIPLPPLAEQNRMVAAYNAKIALAENEEVQAKQLEQGIDDYLFEKLSIDRKINTVKNSRLQFINASKVSVWGADRLLQGGNNSILHSSVFQNKKLSEVAHINPRTDLTNLANTDAMSFIPMECVSDEYGDVMELRQGKKAASKGYTKFQDDDLIWARITPCMQNGKSAIVKNLTNKLGYGSTEYHVVRIKNHDCSLEFVHILLRTNTILQDATHYFTGSAGQQRVPKSYLENLEIPIPPLKIQQEIAQHIANLKSQIKHLKTRAEQNRAEAIKAFEQAIFNH